MMTFSNKRFQSKLVSPFALMVFSGLLISSICIERTAEAKPTDHPKANSKSSIPKALKEAIKNRLARIEPDGPEATGYHALNVKQGMKLRFTSKGVELKPQGQTDNPWQWGMTLSSYGFEGQLKPVGKATMRSEGSSIVYDRGNLKEWYVNEGRGIEQGFTLTQPPLGEDEAKSTTLVLAFDLSGDLSPRWQKEGESILFVNKDNRTVIRYDQLEVYDATGQELSAQLVLDEGQVLIKVAADEAIYPIVVDPVIAGEQTKLTASDGAEGDFFGESVSLSGDTALIGAPGDDGNGPQSGSAYVFVRSGNTWTEQAKLLPSDGAQGDEFGLSVSLSGDTALIGAPGTNINEFKSAAYVFVRSGSIWTEQAKLIASGSRQGDIFGGSVSLSGDTALIGAPGDDDNGPQSGSAYIFVRSGSTWTQQAKLKPSDGFRRDERFGFSTSLSGDTALIGAFGTNVFGFGSGSAYIFVRLGNTWIEQAELLPSDVGVSGMFVRAVSLSGDTALIGTSSSAYVFVRSGNTWTEQAKLKISVSSLSLSGDTALIGVVGLAVVFERSGSTWTEQGRLKPSDGPTGNNSFGNSVSLSGNTAFIGAFKDDENGTGSGSVYPFELHQGIKLLPSDGNADDFFGDSVSLSGNTALVGSWGDDENGTDSGSAYVFVRSGSAWVQQAKLHPLDGNAGDAFGFFVSLSGDTALIGALNDDDNGTNSGSAYIFVRTGTIWTQQAKLLPSDGAEDDTFGSRVALSGNTALIAATFDSNNGRGTGSAYIFVRSGNTWTQETKLLPPQGANAVEFGIAVSLSGNTVIIGDSGDDDKGLNAGAVYVFVRSGNIWTQQAKLKPADGTQGDSFGFSISLSDDTALIGAFFDDDNGTHSGSAYIFERSGNVWTEQDKLLPSDGSSGDLFGVRVSLSGYHALIGATQDDDNGIDSGSVYVFERSGSTWTEAPKLLPPDGAADDWFGTSVSLSGGYALIGAVQDDYNGMDSGSAYVFPLSGSNLSVTQSDSPDPVTIGDDLTYTVTVANEGPEVATGVVLTNTLPAGVEFVSATTGQGSCQELSGSISCDLGVLAKGSTVTVTVIVVATEEGHITHTVAVSSDRVDPDKSNNIISEETQINAIPSPPNQPPSIPELIAPTNGQTGLDTTITFEWNASSDPEGHSLSYDLTYCEDKNFGLGCKGFRLTKAMSRESRFATLAYGMGLMMGVVLIACRKKIVLVLVVLCLSSAFFVSCGDSSNNGGGALISGDFTMTVSGLKSGTVYFWKVRANDNMGGATYSEVRRFTTE